MTVLLSTIRSQLRSPGIYVQLPLVYARESNALASEILFDLCQREGMLPQQVVLHADKNNLRKDTPRLANLLQLGIMPSFSRLGFSNDNSYLKWLFKTLKDHHKYLLKLLADLRVAQQWVDGLAARYNHEHCHNDICFVTPTQRHEGQAEKLLAQRKVLYEITRTAHRHWSGAIQNRQKIQSAHLSPDQVGTKEDQPKEVTFD